MNITEPNTAPPMCKTKNAEELHSPQNPVENMATAVVAPVIKQRQNSTPEVQNRPSKKKSKNEKAVTSALSSNTPRVKKRAVKKKISPLNKPSTSEFSDQGNVVTSPVAERLEEETSGACPGPSTSDTSIKDVEMQDVSLDILGNLKEKKETVLDTTACYYIVVDTNVLIRELHLINELKDTPLDGCGPPHIFIPWVVLEELDNLKKHNRGIKVPVGDAIRYLNSVLGIHPRFHGQSPTEAVEWSKSYSKCNDDKILECCVALQDKYIKNNMPAEKVILLTNDKNLVNKARILKVNVHDFDSLMQKVKPDTTFNYHDIKKNKKNEVVSSSTVSISAAQEKFLQNKRESCRRKVDATMVNARWRLKHVLTDFFSIEMHKAYKEMWLSFGVNTKVLPGILTGIIKYWSAVFRLFFSEKDKRNFELLLEKVSPPEGFGFGDKDACLIILSAIEEVFREVKKRQPSLNVPIELIQQYRLPCVSAFDDYSEAERLIRIEEEKCVNRLLDDDWNAIFHLSGMILDYYNVPHDYDYEIPTHPLPDLQIRILYTQLFPPVKIFKDLFIRMNGAIKECKPVQKISKRLAKALLEFIPSIRCFVMDADEELPKYPFFNSRALERFFSSPQNKEKVEIGIKEIIKFSDKLEEARIAMLQCRHLKGKPKPETETETMMVDD